MNRTLILVLLGLLSLTAHDVRAKVPLAECNQKLPVTRSYLENLPEHQNVAIVPASQAALFRDACDTVFKMQPQARRANGNALSLKEFDDAASVMFTSMLSESAEGVKPSSFEATYAAALNLQQGMSLPMPRKFVLVNVKCAQGVCPPGLDWYEVNGERVKAEPKIWVESGTVVLIGLKGDDVLCRRKFMTQYPNAMSVECRP